MKRFNKILKLIGLFAFAILVVNVNACSKKGSSNNNGYLYGFGNLPPGSSIYGSGIGQTADGAVLALQFMVSPNGQAAAQGVLTIPGPLMGCAIPPGQYQIGTAAPGQITGGDTFVNIQLQANNGMPVVLAQAILWSDLIQNQYFGVSHRMFAVTNIPGCPLTFD
jgi:hypothetical protein